MQKVFHDQLSHWGEGAVYLDFVTAMESVIKPCCYNVENGDVLVQHFLRAYVGQVVWSLLLYLLQVTLTSCAEGFLGKQNHKESFLNETAECLCMN